MKNLSLKVLTVLIFTVLAIGVNALDVHPFSVSITKGEAKKLVIDLTNMQASMVKCSISDDKGRLVYSGKIDVYNEGSNQKYDLSNLGEGIYTITIDDLMKVEKLTFKINRDNISFENAKSEIIYKPTVWVNNDKTVDFSLLSLGEKVKIELRYESDVIYSATFKDQSTINTVFNLNKLKSGEYTMAITYKGYTFLRYLSI